MAPEGYVFTGSSKTPTQSIDGASSNEAAVLHGAKNIVLEDRMINPPGPGEAQIAVKATGLCGSDLHYYAHGKNGDFVVREPFVLGHEAAGIISAIGEGVTEFKVGDRVAIEAGIHCGTCRSCKTVKYAASAKTFPHVQGTLQTFINHPAKYLHIMPDSCTYEQASLVEPLSVVLHATRRASIQASQSVLVLGAGAVGILACALAKALGAGMIVAVDVDERRTKFAVEEGFASVGHTLPRAPRPETTEESLALARQMAEGLLNQHLPGTEGFDVVYECTGVASCIQAGIYAAAPGGKVALIGMGTPIATLPLSVAALREVDLIGVFRFCNTYKEALTLFGTGRLPGVNKIVTTRYPLKRAKDAFETLMRGHDENGRMVVKVMVGDYDE
ncbi:hypothetical protein FRC02_010841 [Tulasnella sp. 418]|nr:hypothetical protein FRC02_010841 [Tulasnella sp. 418]